MLAPRCLRCGFTACPQRYGSSQRFRVFYGVGVGQAQETLTVFAKGGYGQYGYTALIQR